MLPKYFLFCFSKYVCVCIYLCKMKKLLTFNSKSSISNGLSVLVDSHTAVVSSVLGEHLRNEELTLPGCLVVDRLEVWVVYHNLKSKQTTLKLQTIGSSVQKGIHELPSISLNSCTIYLSFSPTFVF